MKPNCCSNNQFLKDVGLTADSLKIMAEENRLKILCILKSGERCVCDIWQDIGIPQNLTSHHLKVLKDAKLIDCRKEGLNVIYRINKEKVGKLSLLLNNLFQYEK